MCVCERLECSVVWRYGGNNEVYEDDNIQSRPPEQRKARRFGFLPVKEKRELAEKSTSMECFLPRESQGGHGLKEPGIMAGDLIFTPAPPHPSLSPH